MTPSSHRSIADILTDVDLMNEILGRAFQEAILDHARAGYPIATSRDGQVVWVPPEEILARFANEANATPRPKAE
ncbi:MAG: hypothetical protein U0736_14195 [Gemmataceae bacterium]